MGQKKVFAENLNKYMRLYKKSRSEVAKDLGVSYSTFSDWVSGKKYPRIDKIELLANYFSISKSDLIEGVDEKDTYSMDIATEMGRILRELNNTQHEMTVDGTPLYDDTRDLLISSLENSLRVAKMMKNRSD